VVSPSWDERKRKELEELTRKREVAQEDLMERHKGDPFRQLCNHDFHALLDRFRGMRDGTAKA
jgi:hypothetical protein